MHFKAFPFYKQFDAMDCGPTALRMIAKHYGKSYSLQFLREKCYIDREGVSLKGISEAAENIGFRTLAVKIPFNGRKDDPCLLNAPTPSIVHWNQNHFVVVYKVNNKNIWIADPADGKFRLTHEDFKKNWISDDDHGIALLIERGLDFYNADDDKETKLNTYSFLKSYLIPHKKLFVQLILGLLLGSVFSLIFPFLTQSLVDIGIDTRNLNFIHIVLIGQIMLFLSGLIVRFIQSWILLHISVRINVGLISDFLIKLMRLPLGFFDTKNTGDLLQRIGDHTRIQGFLTNSSLSFLLSIVNIIIFGIVLAVYSAKIFVIFLIAAVVYILWIMFFLKKRREIDYMAFQQMSDNQDSLIEIIQGMPEIKLQGSEQKRRWKWANIQAKLFRVQMKSLTISQYQDAGGLFINQLKDILITFMAAKSVLDGSMTLGMMLAVQYIIGQLNSPLQQLIGFIRSAQDATISLERLAEVHNQGNEEENKVLRSNIIPEGDIIIETLSFSYTPISVEVLKEINLTIPRGKITAIVGTSGSGKTTLIKLLLGFYNPVRGMIKVGNIPFDSIHRKIWRDRCGVVMQDGFIFSDTMSNNIAESAENIDFLKLIKAANTANIMEFVNSMPLGFNTKIGAKGNGISQGQKQRFLIARAVYKDPEFIFFDEATNALDANNEKIIMENLSEFFRNKTVIVVAHRLSTVKNADQIVVLEDGKIVEIGNHKELVKAKGAYFTLVKNQLELGQ
ncbi:MAG: peptidase domain-containing ABC transporter [Saprospiraceae bacterium]|nr:peptidase domain-containing ABC transporter [Saprospiraceae bacterium]